MSRPCAACGQPEARSSIGGVPVCAGCRPALLDRIEATRIAGKTADAAKEALALLRESATTYLLRDIPADLWLQAKHASVDRGVSLRDLLLSALRNEMDRPPAGD